MRGNVKVTFYRIFITREYAYQTIGNKNRHIRLTGESSIDGEYHHYIFFFKIFLYDGGPFGDILPDILVEMDGVDNAKPLLPVHFVQILLTCLQCRSLLAVTMLFYLFCITDNVRHKFSNLFMSQGSTHIVCS